MWICDLRNPAAFYSNITALALFNHFCGQSGNHKLDMALLTIHMSQYHKGMSDIPECIFILEEAPQKAVRASLPGVTNQTLTILASAALLAANTFPCTTKLWEELDLADKTWAVWKTAFLAAHKKRANCFSATGRADNLGQNNLAHAN
jgi:hypothetical protein